MIRCRVKPTTTIACAGLWLGLAACAGLPESQPQPAKRNVILFLGDGMGVSTVTAARILAGQQQGQTGEEYVLSFEQFPQVALVKTYNTNSQVPDSAGTMTAIVTGQKTSIGVLSVTETVSFNDCTAALANEMTTLLDLAEQGGYATGVVTTARITHATPAATYAHVPNRNWESDAMMPRVAKAAGCRDIAKQLVDYAEGDGIDVILGGGRGAFLRTTEADPEYPDKTGFRKDGVNLVEQWLKVDSSRRYVWNEAQFQALAASDKGAVLGLFEPSHMQWEADRAGDAGGEPSIAEMTRFAIERLSQNERGYFLMVEGGRIDHGHHDGNAYRALSDTVAMADAVQVAMDLTDANDTLILVTADHGHTLTISGYPRRGNPILGLVEDPIGGLAKDAEGRPYTTLSYANGPGYQAELADLSDVDTEAADYRQAATLPMPAETHGGEDVAAYARGLNARALGGVIEQNALFEIMKNALLGGSP